MMYHMSRSRIPYFADVNGLVWNPMGCGCSKRCDGCWAKLKVAPRMKCPKCRAFEPHFHAERLDAPLRRKKREVIGVELTGDLFDRAHDGAHVLACLSMMQIACWHKYVVLTQQPYNLAEVVWQLRDGTRWDDHIYWGVTIRDQADAERNISRMLAAGLRNLWVSVEPQHGPVELRWSSRHAAGVWMPPPGPLPIPGQPHREFPPWIAAVIVGCDNRPEIPFELAWLEKVVADCRASHVPVYVKQLRLKSGGPVLTNPADFPEALRIRQLLWNPAGWTMNPPKPSAPPPNAS